MFSSRFRFGLVALALVCVACIPAAAQFEMPHCWDISAEIPYADSPKEKLVLQVITPNGKNLNPIYKPGDSGKGKGIIDVISGGWNSSQGRQDEHKAAGLYDILASRGYTVFCTLYVDPVGFEPLTCETARKPDLGYCGPNARAFKARVPNG